VRDREPWREVRNEPPPTWWGRLGWWKWIVVALLAGVLASVLGGCRTIDTTEHCVATRYGKVISEKGEPGIASEIMKDWECFPLTDQNFPSNDKTEKMDVQTSDPVTLEAELAMVYAYEPGTIYNLFLTKRSDEAVESEILNSLRSGTRDAFSGWSVAEVFSEQRAHLADSIKVYVQKKLGDRAVLKQVYVREIKAPQSIEAARIASAEQSLRLSQARQQAQIDSVNANAKLFTARADAQTIDLKGKQYQENPKMLDLEIARARSAICSGKSLTTCVLGGSVADIWGR
jgi:regulator of protease activity HflC (stomatin/prohibitin superfamily)